MLGYLYIHKKVSHQYRPISYKLVRIFKYGNVTGYENHQIKGVMRKNQLLFSMNMDIMKGLYLVM